VCRILVNLVEEWEIFCEAWRCVELAKNHDEWRTLLLVVWNVRVPSANLVKHRAYLRYPTALEEVTHFMNAVNSFRNFRILTACSDPAPL
jgi:hypothetical protein